MAVIKDLTSDYSGNLTFSAGPPFTSYTVERVNLVRNREREVEVGDLPENDPGGCEGLREESTSLMGSNFPIDI